jgi:hypothetical protein
MSNIRTTPKQGTAVAVLLTERYQLSETCIFCLVPYIATRQLKVSHLQQLGAIKNEMVSLLPAHLYFTTHPFGTNIGVNLGNLWLWVTLLRPLWFHQN